MKISLANIKESREIFQLEESLSLEGLEGRVGEGSVRLRATVDPVGDRWHVGAEVVAELPVTCDRCSKQLTGELRGEFMLIVLRRPVEGFDPEDSDEVVLLQPDTWEVDLTPKVIETIWLEIPIAMDCVTLGLEQCPEYEKLIDDGDEPPQEKRTDPRWDVLKQLKHEMESGSDEPTSPQRED